MYKDRWTNEHLPSSDVHPHGPTNASDSNKPSLGTIDCCILEPWAMPTCLESTSIPRDPTYHHRSRPTLLLAVDNKASLTPGGSASISIARGVMVPAIAIMSRALHTRETSSLLPQRVTAVVPPRALGIPFVMKTVAPLEHRNMLYWSATPRQALWRR